MGIAVVFSLIGAVLFFCYLYFKIKYGHQRKAEGKPQKPFQEVAFYKQGLKSQEKLIVKPDITNYQHQLEYIQGCELTAKKPINREASKYYYFLQEWIELQQLNWFLSFEVAMGAFIKIKGNYDQTIASAYNSKRVDFLIIDQYGNPKCVIEYNGSGHRLSNDTNERMLVKKLVLQKADIPLIEIPQQFDKKALFDSLNKLF